MNSQNLTIRKEFLKDYSSIKYWKFEVIYEVDGKESVGLIEIELNDPPRNGTCSIFPLNGTILTKFTVNCSNWFDENEIKDYSIWISNSTIISYSISSQIQLRLPIENLINPTELNLFVRIKDSFDCSIDFDLPRIVVEFHIEDVSSLIPNIHTALINSNWNEIDYQNPLIYSLYTGNQNEVLQTLNSLIQISNLLSEQNLYSVLNGKSHFVLYKNLLFNLN